MKRIDRLHFLVHGFCYAEISFGSDDGRFKPYLERERVCAEQWRARLRAFAPSEALAVIPWPGQSRGPSVDYLAFAASVLCDRCFVLDCAAPQPPAVSSGDTNREEYDTALHADACCRQLKQLLTERGYEFDPKTVSAEGWGASFEGCVTKYTLNIRRVLGLANAIAIPFELTVPDAVFLLDAVCVESALLQEDLRLFVFRKGDQWFALFTGTTETLGAPARRVRLEDGADHLIIQSKQGIRLWPDPEPYQLQDVPPEYQEPPQSVVKGERDHLDIPISAGYVYRLAKAPAYVFAAPGVPPDEFRRTLIGAHPA